METSADTLAALNDIHIHDTDTHLTEPPDLWVSRVSSKWGDQIPHAVRDAETGVDSWYVGDERILGVAEMATAMYTEMTPAFPPTLEDTFPAAWRAKDRIAYMDDEGIFSQILYPNILGFIHPAILRLDQRLLLEIVQAYNDYQSEFCLEDPARLIPMTYLPWWDIDASIKELARCAQYGHKGVVLAWEFERHGLPRLRENHWEPLLREIEEMGLPISFHIGFGGTVLQDHQTINTDPNDKQRLLDILANSSNGTMANSRCVTELIMGRICHRYPTLKFVSVESGIGYFPFLLEWLDFHFMNTAAHRDHPDMLLPSEYFRRQIYGTFWFESDAARLLDFYPDNFMFETDFPHASGLTPGPNTTTVKNARDTITANLSTVPRDLLVKVLQDNAASIYGLTRAS